MNDTVTLSKLAADGLTSIGIGDIERQEQPERMAWIALVLRYVPDTERVFPLGKWATIQAIDAQVLRAAMARAALAAGKGDDNG